MNRGKLKEFEGSTGIVGPVRVCRTVDRRTYFLKRFEVIIVIILRPLEHHVFKEVCKTCPADHFVL